MPKFQIKFELKNYRFSHESIKGVKNLQKDQDNKADHLKDFKTIQLNDHAQKISIDKIQVEHILGNFDY